MSSWKELLKGNDAIDCGGMYSDSELGISSPYSLLIRKVALHLLAIFFFWKIVNFTLGPFIRFAATNSWEPTDPERMLRFLESWDELLPRPRQVLQGILNNMVMPKLLAAVHGSHVEKLFPYMHGCIHGFHFQETKWSLCTIQFSLSWNGST
ncbi:hypothetical protein AMTRI_Chr02g257220 [Amborella trichopoda]